jgi:ectoine hydroxylase-related dioxygenase (phytanoyl-CoA dioxygenase family)
VYGETLNHEIVVTPVPRGIPQLRRIVGTHFSLSTAEYMAMTQPQFHAVVSAAQDEMNARCMPHRLAESIHPAIAAFLETEDIMVQGQLYLRASRPNTAIDIVGWHRESFYGAPIETANLWIPVLNVTPDNTLRYIPGSERLDEWEITTEQAEDERIHKGSSSHHIGLLYAPKHITGGVDFKRAKPMVVPDGSAALFSGELVHGAAENTSDKIRFSVDVRLLARAHMSRAKAGYFVPLN